MQGWIAGVLAVLFFCLLFLLLLQVVMHKRLNHDENMYVGNGALLLRGWWPYADYPSFQMPLLSLIYGAAFLLPGHMLLVARLINTFCALGCCLLLFVLVQRVLTGVSAPARLGVAASGVLIYVSGAQFVYTVGRAWNHDVPLLLTLGALTVFTSPRRNREAGVPLLVAGGLLGLATSSRLLFAVAAVPFVGAIVCVPAVSRVRGVAWFAGGFGLGLVPCVPFLLRDPARFVFDNVTYHGLNEQYWRALNYTRAMTLSGKLGYALDVLREATDSWVLLVGAVLVGALAARARPRRGSESVALALLTAAALFAGGLVPTPTWPQYFYAPFALLAVGFVVGVAAMLRTRLWKVGMTLLVVVGAVSVASGVQRYATLGHLRSFDDWTPGMVATVSGEIRAAVPRGTVVTLAPIYVLEAGLDIFPGLASGPFGYRVATLLPPPEREEHGLMSPQDTLRRMGERPPEAILTGAEDEMEAPLVGFATERGYTAKELSNGLSLWVRP